MRSIFWSSSTVLNLAYMSRVKILERKMSTVTREVGRLRSFLSSLMVEDPEGRYKLSFVRRIQIASTRKPNRTFKNAKSFLADLDEVWFKFSTTVLFSNWWRGYQREFNNSLRRRLWLSKRIRSIQPYTLNVFQDHLQESSPTEWHVIIEWRSNFSMRLTFNC